MYINVQITTMKILVKERGSNANGGQDFLICWFKQIKLHIFFYFLFFGGPPFAEKKQQPLLLKRKKTSL